jgi:hypothetical protein
VRLYGGASAAIALACAPTPFGRFPRADMRFGQGDTPLARHSWLVAQKKIRKLNKSKTYFVFFVTFVFHK